MPPKPLTLAFDTSVAHCAAALLLGDRVVAQQVEEMAKGQAERLFGVLEAVLADGGADWRDLTRIGVGIGPGNFTGIRISVSSARGLALSLGIPAIGVSTFEALAHGLDRPVVAGVDGRGGRVYLQEFKDTGAQEPVTVDAGDTGHFSTGTRFVGYVGGLFAGVECQPNEPIAVAIGRIAADPGARLGQRPVPLYMRAPDAAPSKITAPVILP